MGDITHNDEKANNYDGIYVLTNSEDGKSYSGKVYYDDFTFQVSTKEAKPLYYKKENDDNGMRIDYSNTGNGGMHKWRMTTDKIRKRDSQSYPYDFSAFYNFSTDVENWCCAHKGSRWSKLSKGKITVLKGSNYSNAETLLDKFDFKRQKELKEQLKRQKQLKELEQKRPKMSRRISNMFSIKKRLSKVFRRTKRNSNGQTKIVQDPKYQKDKKTLPAVPLPSTKTDEQKMYSITPKTKSQRVQKPEKVKTVQKSEKLKTVQKPKELKTVQKQKKLKTVTTKQSDRKQSGPRTKESKSKPDVSNPNTGKSRVKNIIYSINAHKKMPPLEDELRSN